MSKRPEKSWSLWCDWLGCDYQFEYGDYTIFGDGYDAHEIVGEYDGWSDRDGLRHYCGKHLAVWASEYENADGTADLPEPPYLLIHDGDTADHNDDGFVSLIPATAAPPTPKPLPEETPVCDCDYWHSKHRFHCATRFPRESVTPKPLPTDPAAVAARVSEEEIT